jgi:CubicO group peptidase (beta-lactamase class C family)
MRILSPALASLMTSCKEGNTLLNGRTFDATSCLDEHFTNFLSASNIPGCSIAILRRGKLAYEQGYGTHNAPVVGADENRPTLPSIPFCIASVSKTVKALTVVLLAQENLLNLDEVVFGETGVLHSMIEGHDSVNPLIHNITIRQLLRHSAGFTPLLNVNDPISDPMFQSRHIASVLGISDPATCTDTIRFMLDVPLLDPPGSKYGYSNFGYCVLGGVIEGVTGMTYLSASRKWLLDAAGVNKNEMNLGSIRLEDNPADESEYHAQAPFDCFGPSVYPGDRNVLCAYGAAFLSESSDVLGGWVASARQLVKIVAAVAPPHCKEGECLLDAIWRNKIAERPPYFPSMSPLWYGLGMIVSVDGDGVDEDDLIWQHDGGDPGTGAALIQMSEERGYAYALIFNGNNGTGLIDEDVGVFDAVGFDRMAKCFDDGEWPVDFYEVPIDHSGASAARIITTSVLFVAFVFAILMLVQC